LIILSLDTTTAAGSIAVLRDGVVLAELTGNPAITHGQRLPEDLTRVLSEASIRIEDVELYAVAAGPGSFTGLRVGIATVQGLAMARGCRIVPVSALEALARSAANPHDPVAAWMDAQRGEVFSEVYAPDGCHVLVPAVSSLPVPLLDAWDPGSHGAAPVFIGDGAVHYRAEILDRFAGEVRVIHPPPLARIIGEIAASAPERAVLPHAVVPLYIRKPDAELARTRRLTGS
jgi:tRNA threonylcarbamoyladenosine biosynthesis protein TsaB